MDSIIGNHNVILTQDDPPYASKEIFTYDWSKHQRKHFSYYWGVDRDYPAVGGPYDWHKDWRYDETFDEHDSLIEKVVYQGNYEDDLWHRKSLEKWSTDTGVCSQCTCNTYSVSNWDEKKRKWQLVQKEQECFNKKGKTVFKVTRYLVSSIDRKNWSLSKDEYMYDTSNVLMSQRRYNVSYKSPDAEKITDFKTKETYVYDGKTFDVEWFYSNSNAFSYDASGRKVFSLTYSANLILIGKDSFIYDASGLKVYHYLFWRAWNQKEWKEPSITFTEFDSLGNELLMEYYYMGDTLRQKSTWDKHKNKIYGIELEKNKRTNYEWKTNNEFTRHYTYDEKGRMLSDDFYAWNGADSTLAYQRKFAYDKK